MKTTPKLALAVAAASAVLLGGGAAYAAIPGANGKVTACRNKATGVPRIIDYEAGQRCTSTESGLNWSVTGPRGPQGLPGPAGPTGPAGKDGVAVSLYLTARSVVFTLPAPLPCTPQPGTTDRCSWTAPAESLAICEATEARVGDLAFNPSGISRPGSAPGGLGGYDSARGVQLFWYNTPGYGSPTGSFTTTVWCLSNTEAAQSLRRVKG